MRTIGVASPAGLHDEAVTLSTTPEPHQVDAATPAAIPLSRRPRPRVDGTKRAAAYYAGSLVVVWFVALAGVIIWVGGRGLHTVTAAVGTLVESGYGLPRILQDLGALAGIVAAVLMLFQVLFMSRFPLFEQGFGRDVIVAVHKKVGFWSFWMILAHAALLAVGYTIAEDANPWTSLGVFTTQLRFAIAATAVLFVAVIGMSVRRVKAKVTYETWHVWHLVAYVAAFFSVPHQIFLGGSFLQSRAATVFWIGLWGAAFAAVGIWRVLLPIIGFFRYDLRIVQVRPDGARGIDVVVSGTNLDRLGAKAGQFFHWRFLGSKGAWKQNPFSISAPPTNDRLRICVRVVGDGTQRMAELRPGMRVFAEGPLGRISGDLRTTDRMLMFAAGAGAGPMVALLTDQEWAPGQAILVSRENDDADAMMVPDIEHLVTERGLVWHRPTGLPNLPSVEGYCGGSSWMPPNPDGTPVDGPGLIRQWVEGQVDDVDVFLCGPPAWMNAVLADLAAAGVPRRNIHVESFDF